MPSARWVSSKFSRYFTKSFVDSRTSDIADIYIYIYKYETRLDENSFSMKRLVPLDIMIN